MGLLRRFKNRISTQFEQGKRKKFFPRWTTPPTRNTAEWLEMFGKSPRLAVVDKISSDLSYVTGKLYRVDADGGKTEITKHPFLDFWARPNPLYEFSSSALWRLHSNYLLLKGEAYFVIERDNNGYPVELWPVPVHWVQQTPYQGYPYYAVKSVNGEILNVSVDDMFVMRDLNPLDPYRRGLGQSEQIADEVEIDEYAAKFQKKFFYNDATPGLLVALPDGGGTQIERFREQWKRLFGGVNNSHSAAVINGSANVIKLADNMKDLDMVNGRLFMRDAVLEHFGVPREIMGITQNSNRATAESAQYIYAANVLTPRIKNREDAINRQLVACYGDDLVWEFDDIVPHDKEYEKGVALEAWNAGLLTKNESREKLGMETVDNGDIYKMGFADMFVGIDEDIAAYSSAAANLQYMDNPAPLTEESANNDVIEIMAEEKILQRAAEIKAERIRRMGVELENARSVQYRKFQAATGNYLGGQAERIKKRLYGDNKADGTIWDILNVNGEEFANIAEDTQSDIIKHFVNALTDWRTEEKLLIDILTPLWTETYTKGTEQIKTFYKINAVQQPTLTSAARLRGGQRVTHITQTTKNKIGQIVADGLIAGTNHQELSKKIMKEMNTTAARSQIIAAQECNTSLLSGNYDMACQGGFRNKTWHYTNYAKARDTHRSLGGKTVPITDAFITDKGNKLMMPCDPDCDVAEEIINCHCFLTYS